MLKVRQAAAIEPYRTVGPRLWSAHLLLRALRGYRNHHIRDL